MISDLRLDNLFNDFLCSCQVDELDNSKIIEECVLMMKEDSSGVSKSNHNGWHSKVFSLQDSMLKPSMKNLSDLAVQALHFANNISHNLEFKHEFKKIDYWININKENSYNVIHGHSKSDLSIIYYAKVNEDSGELVLMRTDGANHTNLYDHRPNLIKYAIQPIVGRLYCFPAHLLHYVTSNKSIESRISIAFNVTVS